MLRVYLKVLLAGMLFAAGNLLSPAASGTLAGETDTMQIKIQNHTFTAVLEDNPAAQAFANSLPLTAKMEDLNANEKYYYLSQPLPTQPQAVHRIQSGDIMLFGSDCLVLFYKDFSTPYRYTRLARIQNPGNLAALAGKGTVKVEFKK